MLDKRWRPKTLQTMSLIRSLLHLLWMAITVVPYTLAILLASLLGWRGPKLYRIARAWLALSVDSARVIMGIRTRVTGMEHLPRGERDGVVLLVKHQSTFETFLMPAIMPHHWPTCSRRSCCTYRFSAGPSAGWT